MGILKSLHDLKVLQADPIRRGWGYYKRMGYSKQWYRRKKMKQRKMKKW